MRLLLELCLIVSSCQGLRLPVAPRVRVPRRAGSLALRATTPQGSTELDGYQLRDVIVARWGKEYDVEITLTEYMGGKVGRWCGHPETNSRGNRPLTYAVPMQAIYLNVSPFSRDLPPFRHESELDYLSHLQAVSELLVKWDRADLVLAEILDSEKEPRRGTIPLLTVPINLRLNGKRTGTPSAAAAAAGTITTTATKPPSPSPSPSPLQRKWSTPSPPRGATDLVWSSSSRPTAAATRLASAQPKRYSLGYVL